MRTITVFYCDTSIWMGLPSKSIWPQQDLPSPGPCGPPGERALVRKRRTLFCWVPAMEFWQARIQRQHERSHSCTRRQFQLVTCSCQAISRRVDFSSIRYIAPLHIIVVSLKYSMAPRNWSNSAVSSKIACWTVHHWICNMYQSFSQRTKPPFSSGISS